MNSKNQGEILSFLYKCENKTATLKEIYEGISFGFDRKQMEIMSIYMSRMVKQGLVERIKKGVFKYKSQYKVKTVMTDKA